MADTTAINMGRRQMPKCTNPRCSLRVDAPTDESCRLCRRRVGDPNHTRPPNCTHKTREHEGVMHLWQWVSNHTNGAGRWFCVRCRLLGPMVD